MRLLILFALLSVAFAASNDSDDPLIAKYPGLVSWFTSHGGIVDPRITIGYDDKGIRGMIATDMIPEGTVLMHCPANVILASNDFGDACAVIESVEEQLKAKEQSKWHTYFDFDDSLGSRIPSEWKAENSRAIDELQGLPPAGETHIHIEWFRESCKGGQELSDTAFRAFKIYLTRAADMGLIPMYALTNHHNGLINTRGERIDNDTGYQMIALTDIAANEQIYISYARSGWESSIAVFNMYGFVEDYPQLWEWSNDELDARSEEDPDDHFFRYIGNEKMEHPVTHSFEPNSYKYQVLVLAPDTAALYPTKELVSILGNGQRSIVEWKEMIEGHHRILRASSVRAMHDSIQAVLESTPTTIEADEKILASEKYLYEKVKKKGRNDLNKADVIQAIEYRLAFKKALKLAADVAEAGTFVEDSDEL